VTGNESKVEKFLTLMKTFGILDLSAHRQSGPAPEIIGRASNNQNFKNSTNKK